MSAKCNPEYKSQPEFSFPFKTISKSDHRFYGTGRLLKYLLAKKTENKYYLPKKVA